MGRVRVVLCALLTSAALLGVAATAGADVVWLCKPGETPNPCEGSQETTFYEQDGSSRVAEPVMEPGQPIDCFYVYPTVSDQQSTNADKSKDDEVQAIARLQAQRFSTQCKVYAPVYRQLTVSSIVRGSADDRAAGREIAYGDVVEAWDDYLANHNAGRGVVLIGHSQGTYMLRRLIRERVDPQPDVRRRLVSALLLGGNVVVRRGTVSGGDFQSIRGCTSAFQVGCVIAFSAFNQPPPDNTRFGRVRDTDTTGAGGPAGPAYEVLCTNPASMRDNARSELQTLLPSERFPPGSIAVGLSTMFGGARPTAPTPWLRPRDRYTARCERINDAHVLMVDEVGSSRRLNPSPTPDWGLHLADANLPLGNLVEIVAYQSWVHRTPGARSRTCEPGGSATVRAKPVRGLRIRRVVASADGRRIGTSRSGRVRVSTDGLRRGWMFIRLRITGRRDGRTVGITQHRFTRTCR